jgi:hypothetical protein
MPSLVVEVVIVALLRVLVVAEAVRLTFFQTAEQEHLIKGMTAATS